MTKSIFDTFGLEDEFYVSEGEGKPINTIGLGARLNGSIVNFGQVDSDAGVGLAEIMTNPFPTLVEAVGAVGHILRELPQDWTTDFTVYRPSSQGPGQWAPKARYEALKLAARVEQPETWTSIEKMVDVASVHLNMSGRDFDPLDPEGQFLMNVLRNAAPHIAAKVHQELGYGFGHLSFWNFADIRRMPDFNRWHQDYDSFNAEFAGKPRFVGEIDPNTDKWKPHPGGECSLYSMVDLGTYWDFVRPKLKSDKKNHYLEVRFLPSMAPGQILPYARVIHGICEEIVSWHQQVKESRPLSRDEGAEVFPYIAERYDNFFPKEMLDETTWNRLLHE